jgi:hypothetical protein
MAKPIPCAILSTISLFSEVQLFFFFGSNFGLLLGGRLAHVDIYHGIEFVAIQFALLEAKQPSPCELGCLLIVVLRLAPKFFGVSAYGPQ